MLVAVAAGCALCVSCVFLSFFFHCRRFLSPFVVIRCSTDSSWARRYTCDPLVVLCRLLCLPHPDLRLFLDLFALGFVLVSVRAYLAAVWVFAGRSGVSEAAVSL